MKVKRFRFVLGLVLTVIMLFCAIPVPALAEELVNAKVTGKFCYEYARSELDMVNEFRTGSEAWYWNSDDTTKTEYAAGTLGALVLDPALEQIAMERARELAVYYSHTRPNRERCFSLTIDGQQSWAENIAYGYTTPESVFTAWREDDDPYSGQGHRRNMLGKAYTAVGFGCFYHQGVYYWAQEFGYASGSQVSEQADREETGYVAYSTSLLGEDYWADEGNCKMSEYTPDSVIEGDWAYYVLKDEAVVTEYVGNDTEITIPSSLGGYPVTKIADEAFSYNYSLRSVTMPEGLKTIGAHAFYASDLSGTITIPASVTSIGTYAFSYMYYVTEFSVSPDNAYYCSDQGVLYTKTKATLLNYPLNNPAKSYTVPAETSLLYCTSFGNARYLENLYVLSDNVRAMTYTFYGDSFDVWCMPESYLYSQLVNGNLSGNVKLHSMLPVINTQPQDTETVLGKYAEFSVGAEGPELTYQWYYSKDNGSTWTEWAGKTNASFTVKGSTTNGGCLYRCVVSNDYGSVTSDIAKLTVYAKPVITGQPEDAEVALGESTVFSVEASGSGLTYQWYYSKNNGSTWTKWKNKTEADLTVKGSTTNNGCLYRCVVSNTYGKVTSAKVRLTVTGTKPVILSNPEDVTGASGETATFKVTAGGSGLNYVWQVSKDSGTTWKNVNADKYPSALTDTLSFIITDSLDGYRYRCKVKNSAGTVTSDAVILTLAGKPVIMTQPESQIVAVGETVVFSISASGNDLTYQWQYSKDGGTTWKNCKSGGYDTPSFSFVSAAAYSGRFYRCIVKNNSGSVTSAIAEFTAK